jgi:hypothetical protein
MDLPEAPPAAPYRIGHGLAWEDRTRVRLGPRAKWTILLPYAVTLLFITAAFVVLERIAPSPSLIGTHERFGLPPCSFHAVFGLPCPGCGGTTAVCYMLHGDPVHALESSILGTAVFIALAGVWVACAVSLILRRPLTVEPSSGLAVRLVPYTIALALVSWVVKIIVTLTVTPAGGP